MKKLNICIAGLGNVGSSVIKLIENNSTYVENKSHLNINILGLSAKNKNKERNFDIKNYNWIENPIDLLNVNNIKPDILIELIGYEKDISYDLVKSALEKKINVITGNKAMLALHGQELFKIAEKNQVSLLFEAAVAGGIPIIKTLKNSIFLNKIKKISGILNGTTNYILTTMETENRSFNDVLDEAKQKGFTSDHESKLDIGGYDAAHKLTLLSTIAYGGYVDFNLNEIQGIENITIEDINFVKRLGFRIKLVSESCLIDNKIYSSTKPKLISLDKPLANANGALNAINIETDQLENLYLEGEGAGGIPTASSILSDIFEISKNTNFNSIGYNINELTKYNKFDSSNLDSKFYLRIRVTDQPGVLSKITSYLNEYNISVEKILQTPNKKENNIPILITTHKIKTSELINSVKKISELEFVNDNISIIPIE
ncbi:homoserine dehydrogenase [Pelagibacteraceae bacterium]|nr:homoserine dehydrogenase [Pelagibacteraceae bacterium]